MLEHSEILKFSIGDRFMNKITNNKMNTDLYEAAPKTFHF